MDRQGARWSPRSSTWTSDSPSRPAGVARRRGASGATDWPVGWDSIREAVLRRGRRERICGRRTNPTESPLPPRGRSIRHGDATADAASSPSTSSTRLIAAHLEHAVDSSRADPAPGAGADAPRRTLRGHSRRTSSTPNYPSVRADHADAVDARSQHIAMPPIRCARRRRTRRRRPVEAATDGVARGVRAAPGRQAGGREDRIVLGDHPDRRRTNQVRGARTGLLGFAARIQRREFGGSVRQRTSKPTRSSSAAEDADVGPRVRLAAGQPRSRRWIWPRPARAYLTRGRALGRRRDRTARHAARGQGRPEAKAETSGSGCVTHNMLAVQSRARQPNGAPCWTLSSTRIDRASEALTGAHPDYWAYVRRLDYHHRLHRRSGERMSRHAERRTDDRGISRPKDAHGAPLPASATADLGPHVLLHRQPDLSVTTTTVENCSPSRSARRCTSPRPGRTCTRDHRKRADEGVSLDGDRSRGRGRRHEVEYALAEHRRDLNGCLHGESHAVVRPGPHADDDRPDRRACWVPGAAVLTGFVFPKFGCTTGADVPRRGRRGGPAARAAPATRCRCSNRPRWCTARRATTNCARSRELLGRTSRPDARRADRRDRHVCDVRHPPRPRPDDLRRAGRRRRHRRHRQPPRAAPTAPGSSSPGRCGSTSPTTSACSGRLLRATPFEEQDAVRSASNWSAGTSTVCCGRSPSTAPTASRARR